MTAREYQNGLLLVLYVAVLLLVIGFGLSWVVALAGALAFILLLVRS